MRIAIDMQGGQSLGSWNRGIGRYTMALTQAMVRNCKDHEIILALNGAFPDSIDRIRAAFVGMLPSDSIKVWHPITPTAHVASANMTRRRTSESVRETFLASLLPDVVLVSSLFEGLGDDAITSVGSIKDRFLTAVILYDLIPFIHRIPYLENPVFKDWYLEKIDHLKNAGLWLAISESSRQEGLRQLGLSEKHCINISTDADEQFKNLEKNAETSSLTKKKYGIKHGFVMYTGGIDFRKNIEGLIRSYSLLPEQLRQHYQLAIVCSAQDINRDQLLALAKQQGLSDGEVILTGFVPEEDLIGLYNCCSLFVFPSWHEGFGLPVLEAMRCGAPVIASNLSSIPEVVGLDEAMFDPHSDEAMVRLMERALIDEEFRQRLMANSRRQSAKFSWNKTSQQAIAVIEQAHAAKTELALKAKNTRKPKLAYVSPLPPERSGISDYSAELLPALAEHYQIEVVVEQAYVSDAWIQEHCPVRTVEWFLKNACSYDRVIYHFGNSHFHQHMFAMLQAVPGVVVLHDFYLSGIAHYMQATGAAPGFFTRTLYQSHGYAALQHLAKANDIEGIVWEYPASRAVLENSVGTIVHSSNSVRLAQQWYGIDASGLKVIPLMRVSAVEVDHSVARQSLGFSESDFIVCSFGMMGPSKLNDRLLQAWLASDLAQDKTCHLVFVGESEGGGYGVEIESKIQRALCTNRIRITGWASTEIFKKYLAVANIGVQLRTLSRGETSATVLDCMNHELPTILNANGSMADLDQSAVWILPDKFDDGDLIQALETLRRDPAKRKQLGESARNIILDKHDPALCAKAYAETIEHFYQTRPPVLFDAYSRLASKMDDDFEDRDLLKFAQSMALTFPRQTSCKQLLVDVSELKEHDAQSGIQRVVRSILKVWLTNPPEGFRVEPVYATQKSGYCYARHFTEQFMTGQNLGLVDEPIDIATGDLFFALDLQPQVQVAQREFYQHLRRQGVKVFFTVYDILCVQMPQYFLPGGSQGHTRWLEVVAEADGAVCISKAVADELKEWLERSNPNRLMAFKVDWFHLGADIDNYKPSFGKTQEGQAVLAQLQILPSFLMVGTLEPRKGHKQVLEAFEHLWSEGFDLNLVIAGKQGWMVDALVKRLRNHPEFSKRLFWLEGISDECLEMLYTASSCLIAASYGEGFGLPLIEAAQKKLPIIARNIPVFREVAGANAYYFEADNADELTQAIIGWLDLYRDNKQPKSDEMPWLTWEESAKCLLNVLLAAASPGSEQMKR